MKIKASISSLLAILLILFSLKVSAQKDEVSSDIEDELDALEDELKTTDLPDLSESVETQELPESTVDPSVIPSPSPKSSAEEKEESDVSMDLGDDFEDLEKDLGPLDDSIQEELSEGDPSTEELELESEPEAEVAEEKKEEGPPPKMEANENPVFNPGIEEKKLLEIASKVGNRIPVDEWNEVATSVSKSSYTVREGDWLWKISKRLFGSGFYYPKIWALNPYIKNPHVIEPGMTLIFTTGSESELPEIQIGEFSAEVDRDALAKTDNTINKFSQFGDDVKPSWLEEKKKLLEKGAYFQYASVDTIEDLVRIGEDQLNKEYELYRPPSSIFDIEIPAAEYDATGFDKQIRFDYDFKEGFHLNTFVSVNIVQDFGRVDASRKRGNYLTSYDSIFVEFEPDLNIVPGDKFSIYKAEGKVAHKNSDRVGLQYTIVGSIQAKRKIDDKWECEILGASYDIITRGDRVTVYTPMIERIIRTFSNRIIEAVIINGHDDLKKTFAFGDVVFLDRGRNDGVELGNVFETYGFRDGITRKIITQNPSYKTGELTVITVTDNFSTALVTQSNDEIPEGGLAITKSRALAAAATKKQEGIAGNELEEIRLKGLNSLDAELNLEDMNDTLLDKAGKVDFTDEEIAELDRQEGENSFLGDEKDLSELEDLEDDLEKAQQLIESAKLDEDKLLDQEGLEDLEAQIDSELPGSLEDFEETEGQKYIDEELSSKDNPYGLTEYDIEEIDELLNIEKLEEQKAENFPIEEEP